MKTVSDFKLTMYNEKHKCPTEKNITCFRRENTVFLFVFKYFWSEKITKYLWTTVRPVLSGHSKRRPNLVFKINHLMQVKSIAECSRRYFRPLLSYHLSLRPSFFSIFEWSRKTGFTVYVESINTVTQTILSYFKYFNSYILNEYRLMICSDL